MMLSFLVTVALMSAVVLSSGGKAPADANAVGHQMTEQDRYIEIAKHLGEVWSKLLLARVLSDNSDFSGDCRTAAGKVQELADEITNHYGMNVGNMKEKARIALGKIEFLKSEYPSLKSDKDHKPSDSRIAGYVNEMIENSDEILEKIGGLPDPKHAKNGGH
ncbi:hypothetical protein DdX_14514 [Ditylenchus destructor]|uniref:Uncharacterized protein n=1 Tax=Ditylenchus destructor TaxID=166010 RepID=A0AAD4MRP6_9BILA|nr:hypothetical protein DdX_14514 [Ditylenchus destructor]